MPVCLFTASIGLMDFGGYEYIISILLSVLILYFYSIKYEKKLSVSKYESLIIVKVYINFLGHKTVQVIHDKFGVHETFKTRANNLNYFDKNNKIEICIIFSSSDDSRPVVSIEE